MPWRKIRASGRGPGEVEIGQSQGLAGARLWRSRYRRADPIYGTASVGYLGDGGWGGGLTCSAGSSALDGYDGPVWIGGYVRLLSGT